MMLMPIPGAVNRILNQIYGSAFLDWEPETLESELQKLSHESLNTYGHDSLITNMINAIRAIRSPKSFALQEWHLFEKVLAALTGKRILPFDAQPPATIIELFYGVEDIKGIFNPNGQPDYDILPELSDETLLYLGLILIDFGVYAFPFEPYKSAIKLALHHHRPDENGEKVIADFEKKLNKLISDKQAIVSLIGLIESQPDVDLFAELNDINLFNAVTAICGFIIVRDDLTDDDMQQALSNDTTKPAPEISASKLPAPEGLSVEAIDNVLSLLTDVVDMSEKQARQITNKSKMPRSGMFLISPEPDEFDPDHKYEGSSHGGASNVISAQDSGESYHTKAPKALKVIDVKGNKNIDPRHQLSQIFADLDI